MEQCGCALRNTYCLAPFNSSRRNHSRDCKSSALAANAVEKNENSADANVAPEIKGDQGDGGTWGDHGGGGTWGQAIKLCVLNSLILLPQGVDTTTGALRDM